MEICEICKVKLGEFYHFKLRSEQVRKMQTEATTISAESYSGTEDIIVYNTVQIVRDYIARHSIAEIVEDENDQRLIIMPKSGSFNMVIVNSEVIEEAVIDEEHDELEPEYLEEDCLDELVTSEDEMISYSVIDELDEDFSVKNEISVSYDEEDDDSDCKNFFEQSTSETAIDSKGSPPNPRRPRNPEKWACNQRKQLRNSGQTYRNSKGNWVEGKKMRESCGLTCRSKCMGRISEEDRQRAFETFWGLGDVVKQRKFLYMHITSAEPKRRRNENSTRSITLQFYLETTNKDGSSQMIQVCKKMFKNTLVVSSQVIQGVVKKYSVAGFKDTRGKFKRKLTPAQILATEHVKKFPFFYIEQNKTKIQCYQEYCNECIVNGIEPVKEGNYRDIFDKQNQGSFLKTELVFCATCHRYYKSTDEERAALQEDFDNHISIGVNKKCRDRALGRIRHQRAVQRKRAQRLLSSKATQSGC